MDSKTLCLGILALGETTGYDIRKMVAEGSFSFFSEAGYGSIYPALGKLADQGLIEYRAEAQSKKPDRKLYKITAKGLKALRTELDKPPAPDKTKSDFLAALLFAEAVAPNRIPDYMKNRLDHHKSQIEILEKMRQQQTDSMSSFVIGYGLAIQKAALTFLEKNADQFD